MFLLPVVAYVLIILISAYRKRNWLEGLVNGWLCFTAVVWGMTEMLSLFYIWTRSAVAICWIIVIVVCVFVAYRMSMFKTSLEFNRHKIKEKYIDIWREDRGYLSLILLVSVVVLFFAIFRSQSTVDSLVYHLSRIMHWIQNRSVGHFAAGTDLQIRYPALSEYYIAQILILGGSDRFANLVQTCAYLMSIGLVYGISRKLGVTRKISFSSSIIYMFIPMAMVQAFTTQTDDIACLFLLIFVSLILDFIKENKLVMDKRGFLNGVKLAASVMFGYLCKPTICFAMVVFFCWMCIERILKKDSIIVLVKYVILGAVTAIILYLPLCYKSYQTYILPYQTETEAEAGNSIKQETEEIEKAGMAGAANTLAPDNFNVISAICDPKVFLVTSVQNLARNSTSACFPEWNKYVEGIVLKIGDFLDVDTSRFSIPKDRLFTYCDTATNPVIMFLTLGAVLCLLFRISRPGKEQIIFCVCAFVSLIAQCGLMGYTPYRTRYLVGVMAVLCIVGAIVIDNLKIRETSKVNIAVFVIALGSIGAGNVLTYEIMNTRDGFSGNTMHQYFVENSDNELLYDNLLQHINNNHYTQIGVEGNIYYEYVLWACINNLERLENVNLHNSPYSVYEDVDYVPDCLIKESADEIKLGDAITCHENEYVCEWTMFGDGNFYGVYSPVG